MKVVDVPEVVKIPLTLEETRDFTFVEFLRGAFDQYEPFGQGIANVRQALKLHGQLDTLNGEKVIRFEDADFTVMKSAVEKSKWRPAVSRYLISFFDAVEKAQDVKV